MSSRSDPAPAGSTAPRRVLVVDDEPDSANTMTLLLRKMGAEVETAYDGRQAIDLVAKFAPEIVLLDIGMPIMDGHEAARRIRALTSDRPVTLVALTGWSGGENARRTRESGFDHHLVKPVDPAALARLIAALPGASAPPAPRVPSPPSAACAEPGPAGGSVRAVPLSQMSHEIRTPLNTIVGAAYLLLNSPLDEEQRALVQTLSRSGEALREILDDVVDLASIESGTLGLDDVWFRPAALVEECLAVVRPDAEERRVGLSCCVEPAVPAALLGDAGRIRRVCLHLLKTAVSTTGAGGVKLNVGSRPAEGGRFEIHVCVGDAGNDGSLGTQACLAHRQDALDPAGVHRSGLTGFGLTVAGMLSERMGGRLWVTGDAAAGSSLHFTFVAPEAPVSELREHAWTCGSTMRVLVADDDAVSRSLAILLLADLGIAADTVTNGREALSAVANTAYDAILLDARMPEMDGVETVREIRRIAPRPRGPSVIAMTASTARPDRDALLAAGADACLTKPLTATALRAALGVVQPSGAGRAEVSAALDMSILDRLRAKRGPGGSDVLDQLVGFFVDDTPVQLAAIRQAASRGDAGDLELAAHRLRGSSASIGAIRMSSLAADVETRAHGGDVAAAAPAIEALELAWLVTRSELDRARRAPL